MNTVEIAGLRFGEGLPKICVPVLGGGMPALLMEIQEVRDLPADLYEWRADHFFGDVSQAISALRDGLNRKPLLCTLRTKEEGGCTEVSPEEYENRLLGLMEAGGFQMLDIELACGTDRTKRLAGLAREKGLGVVVSRHDFEKTPAENDMVRTLAQMKLLGADLPKLAVTPRSPGDVLALLSATYRASRELGPVITVAMGDMGKISRVSGALFGSCLTFGAGRSASAPGQINAEDLRAILEDLSPWEKGKDHET